MFEQLSGRRPKLLDEERYRNYAVLAPYLPDTGEFLFQVRSEKLNRQPGEVCFPGGHIEDGEKPLQAAIRETTEELLIPEENIQVIAPLDVMITPFYYRIYPCLASLRNYNATFNRDEVQEVFTVPFEFFLTQEPLVYQNKISTIPEDDRFPYDLLGVKTYPWASTRYPVLFYQYEDHVIWGMTARFMQNIVRLYRQPASDSETP